MKRFKNNNLIPFYYLYNGINLYVMSRKYGFIAYFPATKLFLINY